MAAWPVVVGFNGVTAAAYAAIAAIVIGGLVRTGQLRTNRLALATAAIFTTCAAHHALHAGRLLLGGDPSHVAAMREAMTGWDVLLVDGAATVAGVTYLGLRRSYGVLLRSPAMFDVATEARYRQLAANLPDTVVFVLDTDLRFALVEGEGLVAAGLHPAEVEGRLARDALGPGAFADLETACKAALAGDATDLDRTDADSGRVYRTRVRPLREDDGDVSGVLLVAEDVTAERAARAELERVHAFSAAVLDASPDVTIIVDLDSGELLWSSRDIWEVLGWPADRAAGRDKPDLTALTAESDLPRTRAADRDVADLRDGESLIVRFRMRAAGGGYRWMSRRSTPFGRAPDGRVRRVLSTVRDVTEIVDAEQRLEHAALHDPLTALPNRSLLLDRLSSAVTRAAVARLELAVLFCDLDGFKRINDTDGHAVGDEVLVEIARRLRSVLRDGDTVARVGGDEFVVVMEPAAGEDPRAAAVTLARRIRDAVARPVRHDGRSYTVSVSIGMRVAAPGHDAADLLRDADIAMYRAKERGKNRVEVYDDLLRADLVERSRVERLLHAALDPAGDRPPVLTVAYQPVHDLTSGRLVGFEALARLHDAHGLPVPPQVFIGVAEETGLIGPLGDAVLDASLAALVRWRAAHPSPRPVRMAVNLSARQAQHADMAVSVHARLAAHGLHPTDLTLELTESVLLDAGSSALHQLTDLHDSGVGIAIDDFGTGYASLRYLTTLPVSGVKIDRSFTAVMTTDPTSAAIVRAVATLAADLGLDCVVEGIETSRQLGLLPAGVHGQGYLLGRPAAQPRVSWPA